MEDTKNFIGLKKVNNFILFKELGRGAFGEVYLSTDDNLDSLTAIKVINRKKLSPIQKNKLLIQLEVLSKLNHKNVTKILDKQKTSNNFYIEMEYSNGPNLYDYVTHYKKKYNKNLNEETVQKLVKQIASGLEYLHKNKIIHRDIKLENLIINFDDISNKTKGLTEEDIYQKKIIYSSLPSKNSDVGDLLKENITVKICDFGFSRKVDENHQASTVLGTPITTAPDVLFLEMGVGHYGTEADMWSLGVCVYELLIGNVPFLKNSVKKIKEDILNGVFDYPKNVDISFESISFINALLQYDPKKRLNAEQLANHKFLVKDYKDLTKMDLSNVNKHIYGTNLKINSRKNESIWVIFEENEESLNSIPSEMDDIEKPIVKKPEPVPIPIPPEPVKEMDEKAIQNEFAKAFDEMNDDFIFIEPKLIPIIPGDDPTVISKVSEFNEDYF